MLYRRPKANAIKRAKPKASISRAWTTLKDILRDILDSTIAKNNLHGHGRCPEKHLSFK
jgi:hypothetical protein